uniref:8-amino-7-oxononanoate synthase n=1 Tax=Alexandrium pacificum TaxID=1565494 RepID=A0AA49X5I2_9DINO|nr:8-amino-7-oxononanoate synthase [Alexandrium pacificum]
MEGARSRGEARPPACGLENSLRAVVEGRRARGLLRGLTVRARGQVDFCSNDYLGFAGCPQLARDIDAALAAYRGSAGDCGLGSTGSRLLSGNSAYYEETEQMLAEFHNAESALLFNSGFDLNLGLYGYVPQPGDVVVYDELVHSSIHEGLRLSRAKSVAFRHNDTGDLRRKLTSIAAERDMAASSGRKPSIIIAVESVYSMDGDCAPLGEFCDAAEEVGASLVVDEAHGTGVFGRQGRGWVAELGLEARVFCRVHTFGKALGVHGAVVVGPKVLREYLINYARPLIYSTSLPTHSLVSVRCAYALLRREADQRQLRLREVLAAFRARLARLPPGRALESPSPIQAVIVPGNAACVAAAQLLQRRGFSVLPIRSPTVPAGTERLRIILHWHNSCEEVHALMDAVEEAIAAAPACEAAARL